MAATELGAAFHALGYDAFPDTRLGQSLVDWRLSRAGETVLVLERNEARVADINYLYGVGDRRDLRWIIVDHAPTSEAMTDAAQRGITLLTKAQLHNEAARRHANAARGGRIPDLGLAHQIEVLSTGNRLLLVFASAWKECLAIFALGLLLGITIHQQAASIVEIIKRILRLN
jgi:hypothetical protein